MIISILTLDINQTDVKLEENRLYKAYAYLHWI